MATYGPIGGNCGNCGNCGTAELRNCGNRPTICDDARPT